MKQNYINLNNIDVCSKFRSTYVVTMQSIYSEKHTE